ncbi:MAG: glycosyltransferase, partial [Bacteroidales bacterium]|nr:glycosyltransferase [Bacteroidales bacterium]
PLWIVFKLYSFYIKAWEIKKSKSADYIIAAYPKIEGHFQKYLKNKPNTIIYNFTTLVPKQNKGIEKKYDVIYIGAINKNRGIFEIVRTADILKKQGRNLKFLVLGPFHNKKLESQVKNLIAKLGLQNCIELHKPVAYLKVEEFLAQSRIALSVFLPVSVYFYAVQIKTFEYMANGLPIVCSNFGTVKTFVEESNSGIPVNPLKPVEIANAIAYLCDNPDKYSEMSDNGIEAVQNVFNWEQMETKLLNIYSKLLK